MRRIVAAAALLLAGCLNADSSVAAFTLDFDFNLHGNGWVANYADVPEAQLGAVNFSSSNRALPDPLDVNTKALYFKGTNVSGDLFMFWYRYVPGLVPLRVYQVQISIEYATAYHAGCTTGVGPATFIKAGATATEPLPSTDSQGIIRLPLEKGNGIDPGRYVQLGDIRNGLTGCPNPGTFAIRHTVIKGQPQNVPTDINGGFFMFIGTQSGALGDQELYITKLQLIVQ